MHCPVSTALAYQRLDAREAPGVLSTVGLAEVETTFFDLGLVVIGIQIAGSHGHTAVAVRKERDHPGLNIKSNIIYDPFPV